MEAVKPIFIFDACSVINLVFIDDDEDFIKRKFYKHQTLISETVFQEIYSNIFKSNMLDADKEKINDFLVILNTRVYRNRELQGDLGEELINNILKFNDYKKNNGEFYSTLLSLFKSRYEGEYVFFVTDDYPAKKVFSNFFSYQQIGHIINSCDFLTYLFWQHNDFSKNLLRKYLINLRAEYRGSISTILKIVREFSQKNQMAILVRFVPPISE